MVVNRLVLVPGEEHPDLPPRASLSRQAVFAPYPRKEEEEEDGHLALLLARQRQPMTKRVFAVNVSTCHSLVMSRLGGHEVGGEVRVVVEAIGPLLRQPSSFSAPWQSSRRLTAAPFSLLRPLMPLPLPLSLARWRQSRLSASLLLLLSRVERGRARSRDQ